MTNASLSLPSKNNDTYEGLAVTEGCLKINDNSLVFEYPEFRLVNKRWDPFYTTAHTLLFEVDKQEFDLSRFGFEAKVHLSKRFLIFVYLE
ncbi:MAG: hypothetical protein L3J24_14280 [Xanthomonadales bacterium]|nr:hypothetical protein [Xanthomonadales bacterium]